MNSESKPWWASKTIWFNLIVALASIAGIAGIEVTPTEQATLVTAIAAVANIILRGMTDKSLTSGEKHEP